MIRFVKFAAIIGVLAVGLVFAAESRASITPIPPGTPLKPYYLDTDLTTWSGLGNVVGSDGYLQQDKVWTYTGGTLPDAEAQFSYNTHLGVDTHTLTVGSASATIFGPVSGQTVDYAIEVLPGATFTDVSLGFTLNGGGSTTITEVITPNVGSAFTLTSVNGTKDTHTIPGGATILNVVETINADGLSQINGISDTFTESVPIPPAVPEPSTIIVWSLLGGLGLTVGWLRRKRAA